MSFFDENKNSDKCPQPNKEHAQKNTLTIFNNILYVKRLNAYPSILHRSTLTIYSSSECKENEFKIPHLQNKYSNSLCLQMTWSYVEQFY